MYTFAYKRASSLQEAAQLFSGDAKFLAGGQTLLATMKQRLTNPCQLIDLQDIAELSGIKKEGNGYVIGAMTRHMDVANHAGLATEIPGLAKLAGGIGDKQVRRMGTIGGSLANNDPSACYPSAVLALNATIATNQRTIKADEYFQGMFTTALQENELIKAVHFPVTTHCAYAKFVQPASRYALVGVFVAKHTDGVRVAITGSSRGVYRHAELEAALQKSFTADAVAGIKVDAADFSDDIHASAAYKASLVIVQTQRAVQAALA
jgi:aerobic carbon-monoxide dehydrogenase medium subunit